VPKVTAIVPELRSNDANNFLVSKTLGANTMTADGVCRLVMSANGALTFFNSATNSTLWRLPGTGVAGIVVLSLTQTGGLLHVDSKGNVMWRSGTELAGVAPYRLAISGCNLMLHDATNSTVWIAPTTCPGGKLLAAWDQCGGRKDAQAPGTCCPSGFGCARRSQNFWQCRPSDELVRATSTCNGTQPGALSLDAACGGLNTCGQDGVCGQACCRSGMYCQRQSAASWQCKAMDSFQGGLLVVKASKSSSSSSSSSSG
jgi:hypothetical protein